MRRRTLVAGAGLAWAVPVRAAPQAAVTIDNFTFAPHGLTVAAGTDVTWTNRDDIPHTIAPREPGRFPPSPPLDTDDAYTASFPTRGTYDYFCSLHPHMQGTIIVE